MPRLKKPVPGRGRWWVPPAETHLPGTDELYTDLGRLHRILDQKDQRALLERALGQQPSRMLAAILATEPPAKALRVTAQFRVTPETLTEISQIGEMLDMKPARALEHLITYLHARLKRVERKRH